MHGSIVHDVQCYLLSALSVNTVYSAAALQGISGSEKNVCNNSTM